MRSLRALQSLSLLATSALALVACEQQQGHVTLQLVASPDPLEAPLEGVAQTLRLTVSGGQGRSGPLLLAVSEGRGRLGGVPVGRGQTITVEGLGPAGNVVSRGRSAPLALGAGEGTLALYIGRLERFSAIAATASGKRRGMVEGRAFHTATPLGDGSLLLVGGTTAPWRAEQTSAPSPTASVEWLDGQALRFSEDSPCDRPRGCLQQARLGHSATHLARDDTVLVAGGSIDAGAAAAPPTTATELYSARSGVFFEGPPLDTTRTGHAAADRGPDQVVLVSGRSGATVTDGVELYRGGMITPLPRLRQARRNFTVTALGDATLIVAGGFDADHHPLATTELLLPGAPQWAGGPALQVARAHHTATLLGDGSVLLVGGLTDDGAATAAVERVDARGASVVVELRTPRWAHTTSLLRDGRVLVVGGFALSLNGSPSNSFEELQIDSNGSFNARAHCCLRLPRAGHSTTLLASGWLLVAGGLTESAALGSGEGTALPQVSDTAEVFVY
ncbi:MAG: hypothetical protein IPL40_15250 [Proteobacteria bacterium]|nr:hypothetical protein [Pseudomonadota bacterium]